MTELRINIADLLDQYREDGDPELDDVPVFPPLWRVETQGRSWLTDRHWLLPESVCVLSSGIDVLPMRGNVEKTSKWLASLADDDLKPCGREFAACFAGTFTLAGLSARTMAGQPDNMAALVTESGERVGILMAVREATDTTTPLPVSDKARAMFTRIERSGVVRYWQAWALAVYLTKECARSGGTS